MQTKKDLVCKRQFYRRVASAAQQTLFEIQNEISDQRIVLCAFHFYIQLTKYKDTGCSKFQGGLFLTFLVFLEKSKMAI